MSSSVGIIIPNIWKNKIHVPNHQPGLYMNYLDGLIYYRWYSYSINIILYLHVMLNVVLELLNCWAIGKISDSKPPTSGNTLGALVVKPFFNPRHSAFLSSPEQVKKRVVFYVWISWIGSQKSACRYN